MEAAGELESNLGALSSTLTFCYQMKRLQESKALKGQDFNTLSRLEEHTLDYLTL